MLGSDILCNLVFVLQFNITYIYVKYTHTTLQETTKICHVQSFIIKIPLILIVDLKHTFASLSERPHFSPNVKRSPISVSFSTIHSRHTLEGVKNIMRWRKSQCYTITLLAASVRWQMHKFLNKNYCTYIAWRYL